MIISLQKIERNMLKFVTRWLKWKKIVRLLVICMMLTDDQLNFWGLMWVNIIIRFFYGLLYFNRNFLIALFKREFAFRPFWKWKSGSLRIVVQFSKWMIEFPFPSKKRALSKSGPGFWTYSGRNENVCFLLRGPTHGYFFLFQARTRICLKILIGDPFLTQSPSRRNMISNIRGFATSKLNN